MRIAVWHNLPSGGGLRVLDEHLRGLASLGHELHVWAPPTAAGCDAIGLATTRHEVPLRIPAQPGGRKELEEAWRGRRADLDAFAEHSAQCADEITDVEPDVVLSYPCQFYRVPAVAQYLEVPSVLYLHEPNRRLYEAPFDFPWVAKPPTRTTPGPSSIRTFVAELVRVERSRIQVRTETEGIHAFDEVLVNSLFSREAVLRAYGRSGAVCALGIDAQRFRLLARPPESRGTVLSVGALVREKNAAFLVQAVAAAGPAVRRFVWIANYVDDRCRQAVERAAAETGIIFELRSSVTDAELLQACADADVFVYAPRLEPFGLAPLEANATGLPVVAVAEGGVRETIFDGVNGVIVEHDVTAFGAAITELLTDVDRARALGLSARAHVVERWPPDASTEQLHAHLERVSRTAGSSAE